MKLLKFELWEVVIIIVNYRFPKKKSPNADVIYVMYSLCFAIKFCTLDDTTAAYLPHKTSKAIKFLLDRGSHVSTELISTDYSR